MDSCDFSIVREGSSLILKVIAATVNTWLFPAKENAPYDTTENRCAFSVFPLRVKDRLVFDCVTSRSTDIVVLIKGSENALIERHEYIGMQNRLTPIEVSHLKPGRYFFEVQIDGIRKFKKRFNKE